MSQRKQGRHSPPRGAAAMTGQLAEAADTAALRDTAASLPAFAGLSRGQVEAVLAPARVRTLHAGTALFHQDEEAHSFFVLLSGHLRVSKVTPDGRQVLVRFMHPGDPCGIAAAMGWTAYPATATAVVDCTLVGWPSSLWPRLAQDCPGLAMNLMQSLGPRLNDTQARVLEISTEPVERRLAHALLRLAGRAGRPSRQGIEIGFPLSRQDLAELTGATIATVSRIMSAWEERRLIEGGRLRVVLRDTAALALLAEQRQG